MMGQAHHDIKNNGHPELNSGSRPVLNLMFLVQLEISQTLYDVHVSLYSRFLAKEGFLVQWYE